MRIKQMDKIFLKYLVSQFILSFILYPCIILIPGDSKSIGSIQNQGVWIKIEKKVYSMFTVQPFVEHKFGCIVEPSDPECYG